MTYVAELTTRLDVSALLALIASFPAEAVYFVRLSARLGWVE